LVAARLEAAALTAAPYAFPFAPLLLAAKGRSVERHTAIVGVLGTPVRDVTLIGVVARHFAQRAPEAT